MSNGNKIIVPEAKEAMNKFKMEAASEVGVNLKQGYNGGQTVKKMCPEQQMKIRHKNRTVQEHFIDISYFVSLGFNI